MRVSMLAVLMIGVFASVSSLAVEGPSSAKKERGEGGGPRPLCSSITPTPFPPQRRVMAARLGVRHICLPAAVCFPANPATRLFMAQAACRGSQLFSRECSAGNWSCPINQYCRPRALGRATVAAIELRACAVGFDRRCWPQMRCTCEVWVRAMRQMQCACDCAN
jgi:hypothetical protein